MFRLRDALHFSAMLQQKNSVQETDANNIIMHYCRLIINQAGMLIDLIALICTNICKQLLCKMTFQLLTHMGYAYSYMLPKYMRTVNVVIFAGGKFRSYVGKTFQVGVIFTILLICPE